MVVNTVISLGRFLCVSPKVTSPTAFSLIPFITFRNGVRFVMIPTLFTKALLVFKKYLKKKVIFG